MLTLAFVEGFILPHGSAIGKFTAARGGISKVMCTQTAMEKRQTAVRMRAQVLIANLTRSRVQRVAIRLRRGVLANAFASTIYIYIYIYIYIMPNMQCDIDSVMKFTSAQRGAPISVSRICFTRDRTALGHHFTHPLLFVNKVFIVNSSEFYIPVTRNFYFV